MLPPRLATGPRSASDTRSTAALAATGDARRTGRAMHYMAGVLTLLWGLVLVAGMAGAQTAGDYLVAQDCTSQDVQPTVGAVTVIDICDGSPGDTVTIDFGLTLNNNTNTTRYDILFGFSDGFDPISGDAHIVTSGCAQQIPGSTTGNLFDDDGQGDCDDLQQSASEALTSSATFQCDALGGDATVNLAPATWWTSQSNAAAVNDGSTLIDGPKCFLDTQTVTIPLGAKINLQKVSLGGTGAFDFTLTGTGVTDTTITTTADGVAALSTADIRPNSYDLSLNGGAGGYAQDVVISEPAPTGWSLTNITCSDDANPNVEIGSFSGGGANGSYTIPASALAVNQTITCTAINDNRGTLQIVKVLNDSAVPGFGEGADTWTLGYKQGGTTIDSGLGTGDSDVASITFADVSAGDYQIFEALAGDSYFYNANMVCTDGSGAEVYNDGGVVASNGTDANFAGTVPVAAGETTTCTITNTLRAGLLTLNKFVENNGVDPVIGTLGAPENWDLIYSISGGAEQAVSSGTQVAVPAGAQVTLREEARVAPDANALPLGLSYTQTGLSCTTGLTGDTVTVNTSSICTFTNTLEVATLTLDKVLDDPNVIGPLSEGDFTISASGTVNDVVLSGAGTSGAGEVLGVVPAGSYSVTESPISADYDLAIDCGAAGSGAGPSLDVTLGSGDTVTCTLTNTYNKARLQITKVVVDGSDAQVAADADAWELGYDGAVDSGTSTGTNTTPIEVLVEPGDYAITEALVGNGLTYDVTLSAGCGTAATTSVSDDQTATVSTLTLAEGDDVSCTVTNTLRTVALTLEKTVDSGNLDTAFTTVAGDWNLSYAGADSGTVTTGTTISVPVGDYTFSEASAAANAGNYDLDSLLCNGVDATGGYTITADTTCVFANVANVAQVTLEKSVPDAGVLNAYVLDADSWDLTLNGATGNNTDAAVTNVLVDPANPVTLAESAGAHDLTYATDLSCTGGGTLTYTAGAQSGSLAVVAGDNVTCTFENTLQAGKLRVVKSVPANDLGVDATDWTMDFDGLDGSNPFGDTVDVSGAGDTGSFDVPAGSYAISEVSNVIGSDAHDSYVLTSVVCTDPTAGTIVEAIGSVASPVTTVPDVPVGAGQDVTCTFTNETAAARLTLTKTVDDGGVAAGTLVPADTDWIIGTATGATPILGVTGTGDVTGVLVTADTYDITESLAGSDMSYDVALVCSGNATPEIDAGATVTTGGTIGSVTLAAGETVTCDITNTLETSVLTLEKAVAANALNVVPEGWDLTFSGPGGATGTGENIEPAITNVTVPAGTFDLSEALNALGTGVNADNYALYGLDTLVCGGTDVTASGQVTLADGDDTTCIFTNVANQGRLTLIKTVDDSGVAGGTNVPDATAWTLSTTGTTPISGVTGSPAVTSQAVTEGTYTVSEVIAGGDLSYDAVMSCTGATSGGFTNAGATVTGAVSADVGTVTVGAGEDITCTIDNTLRTATVTLVKQIDPAANDLGVVATGWDLTANGPGGATVSGTTGVALSVPLGSYDFAEALNATAAADAALYDTLQSLVCGTTTVASNVTAGAGGVVTVPGPYDVTGDVTCTFTNTTTKARLTLVKDPIVGSVDTGNVPSEDDWTLSFSGTDSGTGSNTDGTITSVVIEAGDYTISETLAGNAYSYGASLSCDNAAATAGTGTVAPGGSYEETGVAIAAGEDVTCTFTNTLQTATLTLEKSVDNGDFGTALITDWDLRFDGPSDADGLGATGTGAVTSVVVPAGAYTLTEENGPANYTLSSLACTGGADANGLDGLDLGAGEDVTCTFQNDITVARVTLVKDVQNPAALDAVALGEDLWDLSVDGGATGNNGDASVTRVLVDPGSIALTEAAPGHDLNYASSLACTGASGATIDNAEASGSGSVTVAAGDDVSCTFTNVLETATLTLVKQVAPNALGVTADGWNLTFDGAAGSGIGDTGQTGSGAVTTVTVPADTYTLTEALTSAVAGDVDYQQYGLESLICEVNGVPGADIKGAPQIAVADGDVVECTFTNSPNTAKVTLVKTLDVPAAYAGLATPADDWVLSVGGNSFTSTAWAAQNIYLTPGSYDLSEANDGEAFLYDAGITCTGGSVSDNGDGSGTLTLAQGDVGSDITCTFANRLETATLSLVKQVENGSVTTDLAVETDWDLTYAGPEAVTGTDVTGGAAVTSVVVPAGDYALSELGTGANSGNYVQQSLTCSDGTLAGATLTLADGDAAECTFVNAINVAELTLIKDVTNDSGGAAVPGDFTLSAGGSAFVQNTPTVVAAGSYALTESPVAGYAPAATALSCSVDGVGSLAGTDLTLSAGDAAVCTFFNDDIVPTYDMVKSVSPGFAQAGETVDYTFTFTNNGPWAITGLAISDPLLGLTDAACGTSPLAAGATTACSFPYTVTQEDVDGAGNSVAVSTGTCASGRGIPNTAVPSADETSTDGEAVTEVDASAGNNSVTLCLPGAEPLITVVKSIDIDGAAVGDVIDYAITVTNEGNVTLSDVTLDDLLEDGDAANITAALSGPALASGDDGNGLLDVGETWIYDATYTVTQAAFDSGLVSNTVSVAATDPNGGPVTDGPSSVTTTFVQGPAITLIKTGTLNDDDGIAGVSAGDTITYNFSVTNTGDVTLSDIIIDDPLISVTGGPVTLAPLASDVSTFTGSYTVTQADIDTGSVPNTATVTGTSPAGVDVSAESSVLVMLEQAPAIDLVKSGLFDAGADGVAEPGEEITYTFTATNTGNMTLTNVTVTDPLDGLSAISPASVTLAVGDSADFTATYAVTQADIDAGEVPNTATVAADEGVSDTADALVVLSQDPAIMLEKRAVAVADFGDPDASGFNDENGDGYASAGETVTYSFQATNTGNVSLTDITLVDPLITDQGGTIFYVSGDAGDDGVMEVGDVWYFTASYVLTQADIDAAQITNQALVTGTGPNDGLVEDVSDDAAAIIAIQALPDFDIVVDVDEPTVDATLLVDPDTGEVVEVTEYSPDQLTYDVSVPNTGNVTLVNPALTFTVTQEAGGGSATLVDPFVITNDTLTSPTNPGYPAEVVSVVLAGGDTDGDGVLDVDETWVYRIVVAIDDALAAEITQADRGSIIGTGTFVADDVRPQSASLTPKTDDDATLVDIEITSPESPGKDLDIAKTTPRDTVRQGDIVPWIITVENNVVGVSEILDVIDTLPNGFVYRDGTATVDGVSVTPVIDGNRVILEDVLVPGDDSVTIRIDTFVGGRVPPGQYVNRVIYVDDGGGSEEATASVIVGAEPVFDCGTVIGKVWDDKNQNGYQDAPSDPRAAPRGLVANDAIFSTSGFGGKGGKLSPPALEPVEEPGIPGVRLVTVDGKIITTDEYGRFHVGCADLPRDGIGSNFTLKLDTRSLPSGYRLTTENPRVVRLTAGKMTKMNFGATISRLVRIDVAGNAFTPGTNDPRPAFVAALGRSVPKFANEPVTVRISYVEKGESGAVMNRRMRNVEQILRQYWRESGKYRLMVEKTVQRPR